MFIKVTNKVTKRNNEVSLTTVKINSKDTCIGEYNFTEKELIHLVKGLYEQRPDIFEELGITDECDCRDCEAELDEYEEIIIAQDERLKYLASRYLKTRELLKEELDNDDDFTEDVLNTNVYTDILGWEEYDKNVYISDDCEQEDMFEEE